MGIIEYYPNSKAELDRFANGSTGSIYLNFGLSMLSIAASLLVTLLTAKTVSVYVFAAFVSSFGVSLVLGLLLLALWSRDRAASGRMVDEIINRMPPQPGVQEPTHTPKVEP